MHKKGVSDDKLIKFLQLIKLEANDNRNYVKKTVKWVLGNIGKRGYTLNKNAIKVASGIQHINSKFFRWIACDAFKEQEHKAIQKRRLT